MRMKGVQARWQSFAFIAARGKLSEPCVLASPGKCICRHRHSSVEPEYEQLSKMLKRWSHSGAHTCRYNQPLSTLYGQSLSVAKSCHLWAAENKNKNSLHTRAVYLLTGSWFKLLQRGCSALVLKKCFWPCVSTQEMFLGLMVNTALADIMMWYTVGYSNIRYISSEKS